MSAISTTYHDLLIEPNTAVLTTLDHEGRPNSSPVWYFFDGQDVYVSTTTDRAKYRNVIHDPRVSFTLVDPAKPLRYLEIRGVVVVDGDPGCEMRDRIASLHGLDDGANFDAPGARRVTLRIEATKVIEH